MSKLLNQAAQNVVKNCLELSPKDRLVIITDNLTAKIAQEITKEAKKITQVKTLKIEDFTKRPAKTIPPQLIKEIKEFSPNLSLYCAQGLPGELPTFRRPLVDEILIGKFHCSHGHMIGVNDQIAKDGLRTNHDFLYHFTLKIYNKAINFEKLVITDEYGTNLQVLFDKRLSWVASHGKIKRSQHWQNLPGTEVFTCPVKVEGTLFGFILGDYFIKEKILEKPVFFQIKNSLVEKIDHPNKKLKQALNKYLFSGKNNNRVGEFAFGTNIFLKKIIGNLLQDEKFPGIHLAFGFPYPHKTKANWTASNHLDVIPLKVTVEADGKTFFENGRFLIN